jgi:hypothetical protein
VQNEVDQEHDDAGGEQARAQRGQRPVAACRAGRTRAWGRRRGSRPRRRARTPRPRGECEEESQDEEGGGGEPEALAAPHQQWRCRGAGRRHATCDFASAWAQVLSATRSTPRFDRSRRGGGISGPVPAEALTRYK